MNTLHVQRLAKLLFLIAFGLTACSPANRTSGNTQSRSDAANNSGESSVTGASGTGSASHPVSEAPAQISLDEFNQRYTALLQAVVTPQNGLVDYPALIRNHSDELVSLTEAVAKPRTFASDTHRLAFLINTHNLLVLHAAASRYPISSIRDIPGFLSLPMRILGEEKSADEIRDQLIRPLNEPRVHMALNLASFGSPPLLNAAYTAGQLDEQLNAQAQRFVNGRSRSIVLPGQLLVSEVFDWFAADFEKPPFKGVRDFLGVYAGPGTALSRAVSVNPPLTIDYLEYNWTLNSSR